MSEKVLLFDRVATWSSFCALEYTFDQFFWNRLTFEGKISGGG